MVDIFYISKIPICNDPIFHADKRFLHRDAMINIRAAEATAENAGESRLGIAGVGAGMRMPIPKYKVRAAPAGGYQHHQPRRDPGRNEVGDVIESCGKTAEQPVGLSLVPDHLIQGVDHLIQHHGRHTSDGIEQ